MKKIVKYALCASFLLYTLPAQASKTVTSSTVSEGEAFVESKSEYVFDNSDDKDGAWKERINAGYGVTSFWGTELEGTVNHSASSNDTEFQSLEWKNKFQFTSQEDSYLDTAIRIGYIADMTGDDPDEIEIKFLASKDFGDFSHRANIIFDREVGDDANNDVNAGFAWSSRYKYADEFQPGLEIYNAFGEMGGAEDFDDQDHRIGPVFYGKFKNGLSYDAGYLIGLSDGAPDGTVKAIVKYAW